MRTASRSSGVSLIDVVVGIALMLTLFTALFGVLRASLALSTLTKARATATELANTQMEYLRGLQYASLGTVGGIPSGSIEPTATSTTNGAPFVVHTRIVYFDDPADGTGASDTNNITNDYKKAEVIVSFVLYGSTNSVTLVSNFAPQGVETP